jgi:hypothetical protein
VPGNYDFVLKVTSGGQSTTQAARIRISPLIITDWWTLPDAFVNVSYIPYTFKALRNGAPVPGTWAVTGDLTVRDATPEDAEVVAAPLDELGYPSHRGCSVSGGLVLPECRPASAGQDGCGRRAR